MLKARTGIDMFKRKVNQFARSLSIVLHTYQVANLYYLRLGFSLIGWQRLAFRLRTNIQMDFRRDTTRTCFIHFPKVIFLRKGKNMGYRQVFRPNQSGSMIFWQTTLLIAPKYGHIGPQGTTFFYEFPGSDNRIFFKGPIS